MNHYPHHIGDFDKATRHLTRIERSVYRDLIELYYDTEQQLPDDIPFLCRKIIARSNEESTAVEQALNEFFTKTPTGWFHDRCEEELEAYRTNTSQRAMAGRASAEAKRLKRERALNGDSTPVERTLNVSKTAPQRHLNDAPTNQEPRTKNQEPIKRAPTAKRSAVPVCPEGIEESLWADYMKVRKAKNAPWTETAMKGLVREAAKAGFTLVGAVEMCVERNWQGFQAKFVEGTAQPQRYSSPPRGANTESTPDPRDPNTRERIENDGIRLGHGPWVPLDDKTGAITSWPMYRQAVQKLRDQERGNHE